MKTKIKIIKTEKQYFEYCDLLENYISKDGEKFKDEIELLTLLIEKWDSENNSFVDLNPVQIIKALMVEHELKAKDLAEILSLSKGTVSKILNYHKGLSKETIRKLAGHFKLSHEAFNRAYKLKSPINRRYRDAGLMNTKKEMR
jgi:HTH-type transcriptional regulator/antitoxin HigA